MLTFQKSRGGKSSFRGGKSSFRGANMRYSALTLGLIVIAILKCLVCICMNRLIHFELLSTKLFVCVFIYLFACLFDCLFSCLFAYLFACLFAY